MFPDRPRLHAPESERLIFDLVSACPNDWTVLHGVARAEKTRSGARVPGGECDFIICIPQRGWLVLEVKGFGIRFINGEWFRTFRGRSRRMSETPMQQAQGNAYDMNRILLDHDPGMNVVPFYHAVAFPSEYATGPEHDTSNTLLPHDCRDVESFHSAIVRIMDETDNRRNSRRRRTSFQIDTIVNAFQTKLESATEMVLLENETLYVSLSDQQNDALAGALLFEKTLIEGPAGAGKTLLAMQIARSSGARGLRTLVLTNTAGQREWMQLETFGTPHLTVDIDNNWVDRINSAHVAAQTAKETLDQISKQLKILTERTKKLVDIVEKAQDSDISGTDYAINVEDRRKLIQEHDQQQATLLRDALDDFTDQNGDLPWDMLIWDEFQHFPYPQTASVIAERFPRVKIFADFQRQDALGIALGQEAEHAIQATISTTPLRLTDNRRNSGNIASAVETLTGLATGQTSTAEGPPVEIHYLPRDLHSDSIADMEEIKFRIDDRIADLPEALGVFDHGGRVVTVIDDHGFLNRAFQFESVIADLPIRRIGGPATSDAEPLIPHVCFSNSRSFGGLESPAVIYMEGKLKNARDNSTNLAAYTKYAALTRARTLLCIFTPEANRDYYQTHLPDARHIPPDKPQSD